MNARFYRTTRDRLHKYTPAAIDVCGTIKQAQRVQQPAGEQLGFEVQ